MCVYTRSYARYSCTYAICGCADVCVSWNCVAASVLFSFYFSHSSVFLFQSIRLPPISHSFRVQWFFFAVSCVSTKNPNEILQHGNMCGERERNWWCARQNNNQPQWKIGLHLFFHPDIIIIKLFHFGLINFGIHIRLTHTHTNTRGVRA